MYEDMGNTFINKFHVFFEGGKFFGSLRQGGGQIFIGHMWTIVGAKMVSKEIEWIQVGSDTNTQKKTA